MTSLDSPIASESNICLQLFHQLCILLDNPDSEGLILPATCIDEFGRFRIWGNNIGALLSFGHRNSLDFRVQGAYKISARVVEFLEDLKEALDDACSIVSDKKPNKVATVSSCDYPGISQDASSDSMLETSEISEVFDTIKDTITSLMKVSIVVRNATPRDRYIKAELAIKNSFLESFDIAHVGHKFPKVNIDTQTWLKERLGKAITQRQQYLKYCRDHHDKFSKSTEHNELHFNLSSEIRNPVSSRDAENLGTQDRAGTSRSVPTSAFAATDASTLQVSKLNSFGNEAEEKADSSSDKLSQTSYATSVHEDAGESKLRALV